MKQIQLNLQGEETHLPGKAHNSNIVKIVYEKALKFYNNKNYKKAEAILQTIFKHSGKNADVNYLMALCLIRLYDDSQRSRDKAIKHLKNVLIINGKEKSKKMSHTLLLLSYLYLKTQEYESARLYLNKLMELDSNFQQAQVYALYGYLFYMKKKYSEAEYYYKQSLEIEPNNANAHNSLGYLYLQQNKNMEEAFRHISRALKHNDTYYAYLDSLGWYYALKQNLSKAIRYLNQSIKAKWHAVTKKHLDYVKSKM